MSLTKWRKDNAFPSISSMFDDFWGKDFHKGVELGTSIPAVNITEETNMYKVEVAVPGCKKEDLNIDVDGNMLSISSERSEEHEEKEEEKLTRREFSYHSFKRSFRMPNTVNRDAITATYEDGLLKITLPKVDIEEASDKRQINVS